MKVLSARCVLPRHLHVEADVVSAFNLNPGHAKLEVARGNLYHSLRIRRCGGGGGNLDKLLWQEVPLMGVTGEGPSGQVVHASKQCAQAVRIAPGGKHGAEAVSLHVKAESRSPSADFGGQLNTVPEIEIMQA